jgi:hypothetical protein
MAVPAPHQSTKLQPFECENFLRQLLQAFLGYACLRFFATQMYFD